MPDTDELTFLSRMTDGQKIIFLAAKKNPTAGVLLCLFLGGVGAHRF
jgi:hypothetical protein